eukprot:GHVS01001716.1.p1 GENE.GHVS01001716.1~~GHVS01001716.1.p1  ORF type:complete len:547 (+),score=63.83 GHVS01001716.1:89-1729(+)
MEETRRYGIVVRSTALFVLLVLLYSMFQLGPSVYKQIDRAIISRRWTSSSTTDICGPTSPDLSWQSAFLQVQDEALFGNGKAIVWECTKYCGGLGDRIRGMVMMMYIAAMTGRGFFIMQTNPVPWEQALLPRDFLWHTMTIPPTVCDWKKRHNGGDACLERLEELHVRDDEGRSVSPFEKRFGNVDAVRANKTMSGRVGDIDGWKRTTPWTGLVGKLPWKKDVVFVKSNRPAANMPGFLDTLIEHMIPRHQELGWQHIRDPTLAQQMFKGLKQIVDSNATGCAMRFLFEPSPGLRAASEHIVNRNFLIRPFGNETADVEVVPAVSLLPFDKFSSVPLTDGLYGRNPAKSFIEHLTDEGIALSTKTGRAVKHVVGVHLRLVPHGPGEAFSDNGYARLSKKESAGGIDCAKDLVASLGWNLTEVVLYVVSDSLYVRRSFPELFGDLVATDADAAIQHVDRVRVKPDDEKQELLGEEPDMDARLAARPVATGYIAALAEVFVLGHSDALVLTKSGFGKMAKSIGLVPNSATWKFVKNGGRLHECVHSWP